MSQTIPITDEQAIEDLRTFDIKFWIDYEKIVNEKGDPIDLSESHIFLRDIYDDQSPKLVVMKPAQVGMSTLEILKNIHDAEMYKMDVIYTLPTDSDVSKFVGGKVNRIINNNPHFLTLTHDKDTIEQKQIGNSMIYFMGTWTKKAAIMHTADRLVHDEKDSSKQDVIADYQARLQHSKYKQTHVFSHPSVPNNGVDVEWQMSDQKEWFVTCPHCSKKQILTWNTEVPKKMSVDMERREFICKHCKGILSNHDRSLGEWIARKRIGSPVKVGERLVKREWSGYHISLLMAPWITAGEIIDKYNDPKQTQDFFYNKVLGLPYAGGDNSVSEETILGNVTSEQNLYQGRMVIGVDTGIKLRCVMGNRQGLIGYWEMKDYMPDAINRLPLTETVEYFLKKFSQSVMVIDQGGDIIGSRKLQSKYPGRVFLCHYIRDRITKDIITWGNGKDAGVVRVDRNRAIQWVIGEFKNHLIKLYNGTRNDWYNYYVHWSHIYRIAEENAQFVPEYVWMRSDRDDYVQATVYWRTGLDRFGEGGSIDLPGAQPEPNSYALNPDDTVSFNPDTMFGGPIDDEDEPWWNQEQEPDWREI